MFAIEQSTNYDPSRPSILDGRPQSMHIPRQTSPLRSPGAYRKENVAPASASPAQRQAMTNYEGSEGTSNAVRPLSPSRFNTSPTKSSLSKKTGSSFRRSGFDPETGIWEDDDDVRNKQLPAGRGLHRHQKSVTFDQAPPQINEYEMTTPAPSSCASGSREGSFESADDDDEEASFERGSSADHDDSFDASLEDTEKTPVVLPEEWRFVSPDTANTELARDEEDVFEDNCGSPAPSAQPGSLAHRPVQSSAGSVDSNGQPRPLPPLPPAGVQPQSRSEGLSGAFERMSVGQRSLPTPPIAATISKADIQRIGTSSSLSADDRLRLMALQEQERERRMRRMGSKEASPVRGAGADEPAVNSGDHGLGLSDPRTLTPQLSRASVLQGLSVQHDVDSRETSEDPPNLSARHDRSSFDPDIPIPSLEDPTQSQIKDEDDPEEIDLYSIPDLYSRRMVSDSDASTNNEDETSQYSQPSMASLASAVVEDGQDTPKAQSPLLESKPTSSERMSLPEFTDFGKSDSFDIGLGQYLAEKEEIATPENVTPASSQLPDLAALRQSIQRPYTPEPVPKANPSPLAFGSECRGPATPDSVVRHSPARSAYSNSTNTNLTESLTASQVDDGRSISPSDSGSVLFNDKERSPVSPILADFHKAKALAVESSHASKTDETYAEEHRQNEASKRVSSLVQLEIPHEQDEDLGLGIEKEFDRVVEAQKVEFELSLQHLRYPFNGRFPSNELLDLKNAKVSYPMETVPDLPKPRGARPLPGADTSASPSRVAFEESFANRPGRRQRGYLMRQNTKIVVASERISQDECRSPELPASNDEGLLRPAPEANQVHPSPRKTSQPAWTAEPWNGKMRRKSIRVGGEKAVSKRKPVEGPVPPLPGQVSNAQETLEAVAEDEIGEEDEWEEGAERGRLFVKVVGVKDLQMPFPQRK